MSNPYTKDLELEIVYKLQSNKIYEVSILSKQSFSLISPEFWISKFIRDFGASLPKGVNYEREYISIEKLQLPALYMYVVRKDYTTLLVSMLGKWKAPEGLLRIAVYNGNQEIVKFLLANGANIHAQEDYALRWAANNGHLEVVKLLLANGVSIHAQNDWALIWAAKNGYLEIVKFLLANGVDIHAQNDKSLILAARDNELEMVKLLLNNGADIHAQEDYALRWTAKNGHLKMVKFLLDNGADITVIAGSKIPTNEINSLIEDYKKDV